VGFEIGWSLGKQDALDGSRHVMAHDFTEDAFDECFGTDQFSAVHRSTSFEERRSLYHVEYVKLTNCLDFSAIRVYKSSWCGGGGS
jgi:hypothetical protein